MVDLSDAEFEAANERGREEFETKPHARSARFDRASGLMTLDIFNGCSFTFPPRQLQGMQSATDEQLEDFELSGIGFGLHWEALEADFTVPGLLAGHFGTRRFMESQRAKLRAIYEQQLRGSSQSGWDVEAAE
jgi:hypothetical protein